jgi:protein-disulfide isomerase
MRYLRGSAVVLGLVLSVSSNGSAQTADEQMKKDIEALKEGQQAIQRDLAEIKRLLQSRPAAAPAPDVLPKDPIAITSEPFKGNGTARVALIEFSDYQCPFCSRYAKDVLPQIRAEYIDTGKIKYVFRDMPLAFHKQAFKAAEAAHCAGAQGKFWEMHDALFYNQDKWNGEATGRPRSPIADLAKGVGLDMSKYNACMDADTYRRQIQAHAAEAETRQVGQTPTFIFNGTKVPGALPFDKFKQYVDEAAKKVPARADTVAKK